MAVFSGPLHKNRETATVAPPRDQRVSLVPEPRQIRPRILNGPPTPPDFFRPGNLACSPDRSTSWGKLHVVDSEKAFSVPRNSDYSIMPKPRPLRAEVHA